MAHSKTFKWSNPAGIAWLVLGLFVLANIGLTLLRLRNKPFNPDELQHLHIAWTIAQGEVLYRDFWDHHGALYSLLNGALIYFSNAEPTLRILFWSRVLSFFATGGVLFLTWLLARQLTLSRLGAFLAVAICSSLYFMQNKGVEMRPDPLQALFWISGLYLLVRNRLDGSFIRAIFAGAFFALAIMANAKAGIGPFFVVVFYFAGHWLCRLSWSEIWRDMSGMFIGACLAVIPFLLYFGAYSAITDFLYYNYVWNFLLNYYWSTVYQGALAGEEAGVAVQNLHFLLDNQLPLLILAAVGAVFWLGALRNKVDDSSRQRAWLFIIAAVGTSLGWLLNQHSQYFMMFLPCWSILIAYALIKMPQMLPEANRTAGRAISGLIAAAAGISMLWYAVSSAPFTESPLLRTQKQFTRNFVAMTSRDEPVALTWNNCGGYMFNPHVGHYWVAMPYISEVIEAISGEHPFDQAFVDAMEAQQVRYVIGVQNWMSEGLSPIARTYLEANFSYSNCLWTRK